MITTVITFSYDHSKTALMQQEKVDFQLVPPGLHQCNATERAIQTVQNHFIASLCSVDPDFPIHLWDRLVPQAEITLNLLHGSRINPKLLLAWAQVARSILTGPLLDPPALASWPTKNPTTAKRGCRI
jgi:hypothetical protein